MTYLQALSLLIMGLKYTKHLNIHGSVIFMPLFIDFLIRVINTIHTQNKLAKKQKDLEDAFKNFKDRD